MADWPKQGGGEGKGAERLGFLIDSGTDRPEHLLAAAAAGRRADGGRAGGVAGRGLGAGARGVPTADVPGERGDR